MFRAFNVPGNNTLIPVVNSFNLIESEWEQAQDTQWADVWKALYNIILVSMLSYYQQTEQVLSHL